MSTYAGPATLVVDGRDVGQLRVRLQIGALDPKRGSESWSGMVANSDYVLWGVAGRRVHIRLPNGRSGQCVIRSSGAIVGFDEPPLGGSTD